MVTIGRKWSHQYARNAGIAEYFRNPNDESWALAFLFSASRQMLRHLDYYNIARRKRLSDHLRLVLNN